MVPLPVAIAWGKAVAYNNYIYFAGGHDGTNVLSSVYVYDIGANTWTAGTSMPGPKFGGAFSISGNKLIYVAGADASVISNTVYIGTINSPASISWSVAGNKYPGINKEISYLNNNNLTDLFPGQTKHKSGSLLPSDAAAYPPGTMYRFDGAPWGSDGIIVAGGDPDASFNPAIPNPCYVYKPGTDTWTQKGEVPTPILGASLGTVSSGSVWKLIVASGLGTTDVENTTQIFQEDLTTATTFQLTVNINGGWNMVSIPGLHPTNQLVLTWWPGKDPSASMFKYSGGYQAVDTLKTGFGYWLKNLGSQTYNTGDEWPAGGIQIVTHDPIAGAMGWNLIGGYENNAAVANITTTPSGLISATVFGYSGGYQPADTLKPGYGYWIKLSAAGQINMPSSALKGTSKIAELINKDWGKIVITDNAGRSYTLYAVEGEVNLEMFELPPAPPSGMFDVRYSSGRYAEDLNKSVQQIDLSGMVYPVKVKAEGIEIRVQDETGRIVNERLSKGEEVTISQNINKLNVSKDIIPDKYALEQNYPNPFNPSTVIEFSIPENAKNVKLTIYNALGERVAELINGSFEPGVYRYQWDAVKFASGLYIYELRTDKFISVKKMMVLK